MQSVAATIRDIAIIVLAVESIIIGILLIVLAWQIYRLTRALHDELTPLLRDVNETVRVARGTTQFVSGNLVKPTVRIARTVAFVRGATRGIRKVISRLR